MNRITDSFRKGCLTGFFSVAAAGVSVAQVYEWSTFAGSSGGVGFRDGPPGVASVKSLYSAVTDPAGTIYLTDPGNHTIRVIAADGTIATLAGKGGFAGHSDGGGANARFSSPGGIARGGDGDLYVADTGNHVIRKISPAGAVTTLAGQPGSPGFLDGMGGNARFSAPSNLALSPAGDLFVADTGNHLIRRIAADGTVTTFGGQAGVAGATDGPPNVALFSKPKGLEFDRNGTLYLADAGNRIVRQITPDGMVSTLAGVAGSSGSTDGVGSAARFNSPEAITVDAAQNVWVTDTLSRTIRRISATDRMVTTIAGKDKRSGTIDGPGADARFIRPSGVTVAPDGSLLVADALRLRRITPDPALVSTLTTNPSAESGATDATGADARFASPEEVAVAANGDLFVAESGNPTIRRITPTAVVTTFAGTAGSRGTADGTGPDARFYLPKGLTFGSSGRLYVADSGNAGAYGLVREITPNATVTTLAGSPGTIAYGESIFVISGIAVDSAGTVYVSEFGSVRKVTPDGTVSLLCGVNAEVTTMTDGTQFRSWRMGHQNGVGSNALFNFPSGLAIDASRNLYVTENRNHAIRKVTQNGTVSTLAGSPEQTSASGSADGIGTSARFNAPESITCDRDGNLFIADSGNHTIRRISTAGVVTTIGGIPGYAGCGVGIGDRALFNNPSGVCTDPSGNIFVADKANHRILKGTPVSQPVIAVQQASGAFVPSAGGTVDFGGVAPGSSGTPVPLTVRNTGSASLDLGELTISGADAADFRLDRSGLADRIPPGGSSLLYLAMTPSAQGPRSGRLRIASNDPSTGWFDIALTGMGNSPPVFPGYSVTARSGFYVSIPLAKLLAVAHDPENDAFQIVAVTSPGVAQDRIDLRSGEILYTARSEFPVTVRFILTLQDARGAISNGEVILNLTNPNPPGPGSMSTNPPKVTMLRDGTVSVAFHGIPGAWYGIERSTNLVTWSRLTMIAADATGNVIYIDPYPPAPNGYYRLSPG